MKKLNIIVVVVFASMLLCNLCFGQTITYAYDASGNRVQREIVYPPIAKPQINNDSTDLQSLDTTAIENTSALIEYFENTTITLFPNPTYGQLEIVMESENDAQKSIITIYDSNGKLVYQSEENSNHIKIDLSEQSKGMYFLKIQVGDNVRDWKIVKM